MLSADKGMPHVVEAIYNLRCTRYLVLADVVLEQFKCYLAKLPATGCSRLFILGTVDHQTKLDLLNASSLPGTSIFTRIHS